MQAEADRAALADRLVELRDLKALGQVRDKSSACARSGSAGGSCSRPPAPGAPPTPPRRAFSTGSVPGRPRQTGSVCVLGSAPNAADDHEKIFDCVASCACTSRPMTTSYLSALISPPPSRSWQRRPAAGGATRCAPRTRRRRESRSPRPAAAPMICRPTGSPLLVKPQHCDSAGTPARFGATVKTSARYICSGSPMRSPNRNAGIGDVGVTMASHLLNAAAKSSAILRRTRSALP